MPVLLPMFYFIKSVARRWVIAMVKKVRQALVIYLRILVYFPIHLWIQHADLMGILLDIFFYHLSIRIVLLWTPGPTLIAISRVRLTVEITIRISLVDTGPTLIVIVILCLRLTVETTIRIALVYTGLMFSQEMIIS